MIFLNNIGKIYRNDICTELTYIVTSQMSLSNILGEKQVCVCVCVLSCRIYNNKNGIINSKKFIFSLENPNLRTFRVEKMFLSYG